MLKNLYLICGKSGSGKTYIVDKLNEKYGYVALQSYTTRLKRCEYDTDHIYVNISDYYNDKENNMIAVDTCFDNNLYWARKEQLPVSDLYVIDKKGIETLKQATYINRPLVVIYLDVSNKRRIYNMRLRGDNKLKINKRLINDEKMFKGIETLADFIINTDEDNKWVTVKNIIDKCEEITAKGEK